MERLPPLQLCYCFRKENNSLLKIVNECSNERIPQLDDELRAYANAFTNAITVSSDNTKVKKNRSLNLGTSISQPELSWI